MSIETTYPIVQYAHKIGKSTAEFTTMDMVNFTKWWMKQPIKEGLVNMAKKYKSTQKDKLSSDQVVDVEQADDSIAQEMNNEEVSADEIVCSMDLTRMDVESLLFSIGRTFEDYDMTDDNVYTMSLTQLKEGLEGV